MIPLPPDAADRFKDSVKNAKPQFFKADSVEETGKLIIDAANLCNLLLPLMGYQIDVIEVAKLLQRMRAT